MLLICCLIWFCSTLVVNMIWRGMSAGSKLLMYPCLSQRHTEPEERGSRDTKTGTLLDYAARARSCVSEVKIKSTGRGTKTPGKKFKTGGQAEVKSSKAFKTGKSTHWQRAGKHQSGMKELMSRKRLQLAHLERQTKKCRVIFSPKCWPPVHLRSHCVKLSNFFNSYLHTWKRESSCITGKLSDY